MKNARKTKAAGLIIVFLLGIIRLNAQDVTTVKAMTQDISNNLDLEAVASVFGDANDLEDFEKSLNDPDLQISNLDLNLDGYVDYLRVVEISETNTHLIAIQAVLGDDLYQDVATIEVERDRSGKTYVQVVGDVYMYGPDYIIEPVYIRPPIFFSYFWRPYYRPYWSPYYWGYYPSYYTYWHPCHTHVYRSHVRVYVNVHHVYHHVSHRRSHVAMQLHNKHRRNDFGRKYPSKSYVMRNRSAKNETVLASRGSDRIVVNSTSRSENSKLTAQRSTKPTKRGEISSSGSKTRVEQTRSATSKVNRSSSLESYRGKNYTERSPRKEVISRSNKAGTGYEYFASKSEKPVYNKRSFETKDVASKSRSYQSSKPEVNDTKQRSYSGKSNTSKSYQSKSMSAKSNQKSYAFNARHNSKQYTSKGNSKPGNNSNRSKIRDR
jgi:hypothetical protein